MTRKYLYIQCDTQLMEAHTPIFCVSCSQVSAQGVRDIHFLAHYAAQHGHFFHLWNSDIDMFLVRLEQSVAYPLLDDVKLVKSRDMVRVFRQNFGKILADFCPHTAHDFRKRTSVDYRISCNISLKNTSA